MRVQQVVDEQREVDPLDVDAGAQRDEVGGRRVGQGRVVGRGQRVQRRRQVAVVGGVLVVDAGEGAPLEQGEIVLQAERQGPGRGGEGRADGVAVVGQDRGAGVERLDVLGVGIAEGHLSLQVVDHLVLQLQVKALALGLAQVAGVLVAAAGQGDLLLDVVPAQIVDAGLDLQVLVEHLVLGADLVAVHGVGVVGRGRLGQAQRGEVGGAEGRRHLRTAPALAIALGVGEVEQVVAVGLELDAALGRQGILAFLARTGRQAAVLGPVGEPVVVEVGVGVANAALDLQLAGDRHGDVGEAGDLGGMRAVVVDVVVVAVLRQQALPPVILGALAEQVLGDLLQLRVVDLFHAELAVALVEHADDVVDAAVRIAGLHPELLGEVALLVGDGVGRAVAAEAWQVEAGRRQQRIQAAGGAGAAGRGIADQLLEVGQVVERALVAGDLLAVEVRGVGDEADPIHVVLHSQRRQHVVVLVPARLRVAVAELAVRGIGDADPVQVGVALVARLVVDRRRDGQLRYRRPGQGRAADRGVHAVGVGIGHLAGRLVNPVDIAAVAPVPAADAEAQLVLHDRAAHRQAEFAAGIAALGARDLGPAIGAVGGQAGLRGDVAHRAAFRPGAEQGALGPAQHLDPIQVEHGGQGVVGVEADDVDLHRGVVEVDAGGRRAGGRGHAADRDVLGGGVEHHAGGVAGDVAEVLDAQDVHLVLGEGGDAHGHLAQHLALAGGGDHHLRHLRAAGVLA